MEKRSLNTIKPKKGATASKKRVGRGWSSKGKYSGRGVKGQKSRAGASGSKLRGLRKLMLSTPKLRGFKSGYKKAEVVNVEKLGKLFKDGEVVTPNALEGKGAITTTRYGAKILGDGELKVKLTVKDCNVSKTAKTKIEAAGGNVA